ncbi:hypothetical protein AC244_30710 [Ensifer adhaerens]|uniref:Uncharacterized protein n=1 Tax=Ensifer adhaerens TaxID=106592 RepID=A0A0L8BFZ4_ENSAD|nr:hypothetical protein AC244_30710 [Ensifer adhaerens]
MRVDKVVIVSVSIEFSLYRLSAFPLVAGKGAFVRRRLRPVATARPCGVAHPVAPGGEPVELGRVPSGFRRPVVAEFFKLQLHLRRAEAEARGKIAVRLELLGKAHGAPAAWH